MANLVFKDEPTGETEYTEVDSHHPLPVKQVGAPAPTANYVGLAFEQITVATAAIGLTPAKFANLGPNCRAVMRLETAEIRYSYDESAPAISTTVGTPLEVLDTLTITTKQNLMQFQAIRTTGVSGKLNVTYEDLQFGQP
ncbi:MAG: hypothetical protein ACRESF_25665 [Pseudomonas sp.]